MSEDSSGKSGWVKFEEEGDGGSPGKKSLGSSSGVSSARGSVNSISEQHQKNSNDQPGSLPISEIQVYCYVMQ